MKLHLIFVYFLSFAAGLLISLPDHAEGTKQLTPDSLYACYIVAGPDFTYSGFAYYTCTPDKKLYVTTSSPSEVIYFGFGNNLEFVIKREGTVIAGPYTINSSSPGYIKFFSQTYAGPDVLSPAGYHAVTFAPGVAGDYDIEFVDQASILKFDITVIDTALSPLTAIEGRLWTQSWSLNTNNIEQPYNAFVATQYVLTEDSVVTSIYYNHMRGHRFDVTCTRNGCFPPPMPFDSSCRSRSGNYHYAQYKIFLNNPDSNLYPTGILGAFTSSLQVDRNCDGTFLFNFSVNKSGSIQIDIETDTTEGIQGEDLVIIDSVFPGPNSIFWNGLNGLGLPVQNGDTVEISMVFMNGLTNIALFDVERHLDGFIIQQVRPEGPPIATYWNDTLLANNGGVLQLTGCLSALPSTGCHSWEGGYGGVGLGSLNTVNTWWYAASGIMDELPYEVKRSPSTPENIAGPQSLCMSATATYTVIPSPLANSDSAGYEWVLSDVGTGVVLFDSVGKGAAITIHFTSFGSGAKRLKVRGSNSNCGYGNYGPGTPGEGILIQVIPAPVITNTSQSYSICTGDTVDILLVSSFPGTTFNYTATATSPSVSGYSGGNENPIHQVLTNSASTIDSVIYRVVPSVSPCNGDTTDFFVTVNPIPQMTNPVTSFAVCAGSTFSLNLTSNIPDANYVWSVMSPSPAVSGFSPDTGTVISQTLLNSGYTSEPVYYSITPFIGGCTGNPLVVTVTVRPLPDLANTPLSYQTCSEDTFSVLLTSHIQNTLFTWTATPSSGFVSGFTQNDTTPTNVLTQTLLNYGISTEQVVYNLIPHSEYCVGDTSFYTVQVKPDPVLTTQPLTATICSGDTVSVGLTSDPPGALFTWICTASSPSLTGYTEQNTPTTELIQSIYNTGLTTGTVTYHLDGIVDGCTNNDTDYVITVKPDPILTTQPLTATICSGDTVSVALTTDPPGALFTWSCTANPASLTGYTEQTVPTVNFIQSVTNNGYTDGTVIFHLVGNVDGCTNNDTDFVITVKPIPDIWFHPTADTVCGGRTVSGTGQTGGSPQPTNLSLQSHVAGTEFSWTASSSSPGISGYNPGNGALIAQVLNNEGNVPGEVTYTATPFSEGCIGDTDSATVRVNPSPIVNFTPCFDTITTTNAKPFKLKGGIPLGGVYTGPGVASETGIFNPAIAGTGTKNITYTYTNIANCSSGISFVIHNSQFIIHNCGSPLTDIRDGKSYSTIQIGFQCWMVENLDYGLEIPANQHQRDNCISEKYVRNSQLVIHNSFYQWDELMKYEDNPGSQGLCPPGWHIPAEADWNTLFSNWTNNAFAASPLKYSGYSGFNAFLTGGNHLNRQWDFENFAAFFWSSTPHGSGKAWAHGMNDYDPSVSTYPAARSNAFSVRCVKDQ